MSLVDIRKKKKADLFDGEEENRVSYLMNLKRYVQ